jgi:predicted NBD/HSP70 family sugar kinase
MRFYTNVHEAYCGIDLHARTMDVCILNRDGEILLHRHMPTTPEIFLKAIAPYRQDLWSRPRETIRGEPKCSPTRASTQGRSVTRSSRTSIAARNTPNDSGISRSPLLARRLPARVRPQLPHS